MLNLSPDVAEELQAFAREHGFADASAAVQALLRAETDRLRRDDMYAPPPAGPVVFGAHRGQGHVPDDFDAPLEDFAEYM